MKYANIEDVGPCVDSIIAKLSKDIESGGSVQIGTYAVTKRGLPFIAQCLRLTENKRQGATKNVQAQALFAEGYSIEQVCSKLQVSCTYLRRQGLLPANLFNSRTNSRKDMVKDHIIEVYAAQGSIHKTKEKTGYSLYLVQRILREAGLTHPNKAGRPAAAPLDPDMAERVKAQYLKTPKLADVASSLGISVYYVKQYLAL